MVPWSVLEESHPELARRGSRRLFEFAEGLAFLSTPQPQGRPRMQPVQPLLCGGRLFILRAPTALRRRLVERREACALQAFPLGGGGAGDFYLAGGLELVGMPSHRSELARQVRRRGRPDDAVYELLVGWALYSGWDAPKGGRLRAVRLQWHAEYSARAGG